MEHKGFGLGSALAWLKPVIPLLIPLHSHPQHPFLFLILSWWQLKIPPHSFLQVFFIFFKLKNVKPSEVHSLKNHIYTARFYYQYFFFFKDQFQTLSEGWLIFKLSSWPHELKLWPMVWYPNKSENIFLELSVMVQVIDTTFSSIPWSILFQLALQGSATAAHLTQAKHFKFFFPIILLFAQQIKYSLFSVIKPFQVCCCITSGTEQAWKSWFPWKLFTDPISLRSFHWKQQNPVERIFSSAVTESNQWKMWTFAPVPQSTFTAFSKFRHHKQREKLQYSFPGVFPKLHWHSC